MSWTYSYSESFIERYKQLPFWKRKVIRKRVKQARRGELKGVRKGKLLYFSLTGIGNVIIAKVDEELQRVEFYRIQIQS